MTSRTTLLTVAALLLCAACTHPPAAVQTPGEGQAKATTPTEPGVAMAAPAALTVPARGGALPDGGLAPAPHAEEHKFVVVLGSSTAAGVGVTIPAHAWVHRVRMHAATHCPMTIVHDLAVGGFTTWNAMPAHMPRDPKRAHSAPAHSIDAALAQHPAVVIVAFPSNDAGEKVPLTETLANHTYFRDRILAAGATPLILGPFPRHFTNPVELAAMTGLRDQLPAIAAPHYIDLWKLFAISDNTMKHDLASGDGAHPGDAGHALIADQVLASPEWKSVCPD